MCFNVSCKLKKTFLKPILCQLFYDLHTINLELTNFSMCGPQAIIFQCQHKNIGVKLWPAHSVMTFEPQSNTNLLLFNTGPPVF